MAWSVKVVIADTSFPIQSAGMPVQSSGQAITRHSGQAYVTYFRFLLSLPIAEGKLIEKER